MSKPAASSEKGGLPIMTLHVTIHGEATAISEQICVSSIFAKLKTVWLKTK
jgi:hypothetical protein